ncbi:MAG TPA: Sir2 family NAD-dependent protein deacetylase [Blastocatellia bacterium]|nr:Sir2 family NAD-dependent protein deacetylase [Blastocatellia bacterium]
MRNLTDEQQIDELRRLLAESSRAAVFTGAGISTESGIPDFRSPGGFWTKHQPIDFSDFLASKEMRRETWRRKMAVDESFAAAAPNRGHRAIAHLVKEGKVGGVITQNIDGLHQKSGVPPEKIIELHGNGTYAHCLRCGRRYELAPLFEAFKVDEEPPVCTRCGGLIKSATISFGQPMPEEPMRRAREETQQCDLFLAIGSSLVVYPAAGFPIMAQRGGARLVIINRDPTELDHIADLVLNVEIGPILGRLAGID